jgi:regulator of replication initiation timing
MRKNTMVGLLFAAALGLSLIGCEDTKARQENEQLKAHVAELVKESGDLGNQVDALTQENAALKQENEQLKKKPKTKKTKKSKHHQRTSNGQGSGGGSVPAYPALLDDPFNHRRESNLIFAANSLELQS